MNKNKFKQYIIISVIAILILCLMMVPIILLNGCTAEAEEFESGLEPTFTELTADLGFKFIFDNNTKIVYIFKDGSYDGGISSYYLLDENDVPHMVKWENNEFVLLPNS